MLKPLLLPVVFACLTGLVWGQELDICAAAQRGLVDLQAAGDGKNSRKVQIILHNPSKKPVQLVIPRYTVLDHPTRQDVLLLEEKHVTVPPGEARMTVPGLCCGRREEQPPGAPSVYTPVPCTGHPGAEQARACYDSALSHCKDNSYPQLPLPPSQIPTIIAQLAYWKNQGSITKEQWEKQASDDLHVTPNSKPEEQKEFHQGTDNIWDAVDLTAKEVKPK